MKPSAQRLMAREGRGGEGGESGVCENPALSPRGSLRPSGVYSGWCITPCLSLGVPLGKTGRGSMNGAGQSNP